MVTYLLLIIHFYHFIIYYFFSLYNKDKFILERTCKRMALKSLNLDMFIDDNKDASYKEVMDELIKYQEKMCMTDCMYRNRKEDKKEEKEKYKLMRKEIRKEVIKEMEETNIFQKILSTITNISKAIKSLAKMVIYIISALFSVDGVKEVLNNKTVSTMEQIYDKSLKVYKFLA